MDDASWDALGQAADRAGRPRADLIRDFARWYAGVPGAELPRPDRTLPDDPDLAAVPRVPTPEEAAAAVAAVAAAARVLEAAIAMARALAVPPERIARVAGHALPPDGTPAG